MKSSQLRRLVEAERHLRLQGKTRRFRIALTTACAAILITAIALLALHLQHTL